MSPLLRSSLDHVIRRLSGHFRGVFSDETVARYVEDSYMQTSARPVTGPNFLPVLIERFSRERLQAVAQAEGLVAKDLPEVLFVCVRNAGRSQMAAALTHQLSDGRVAVRSAGTMPGDRIHPIVVTAMEEIGVDVRLEFPKPLTDEVIRAADVVVTLGCGDSCPIYPGKRYQDWDIADPAGEPIEIVRRIRDDIQAHVSELLRTLTDPQRPVPAGPTPITGAPS
jgi:protein-tyrosine-phosphatase